LRVPENQRQEQNTEDISESYSARIFLVQQFHFFQTGSYVNPLACLIGIRVH